MENKRWLVTGAAGFLGSHVVELLLNQKQTVLGIDDLSWGRESHLDILKESSHGFFERTDLRDTARLRDVVQKFKPDIIIHLAALHFIPEAMKNPTTTVDINVRGTQSLLEALSATSYEALWFASTGDVYEKSFDDSNEDSTRMQPYNIYGLTKWIGEQLIHLEHMRAPRRRYLVGRVYNLIGPRETNPHIVPEIMKQLRTTPGKVSLGNIHPVRDYVPVDQCARAIIEICQKVNKPYFVCNVATGRGQSVKDLIDTLEILMARSIEVQIDPARVRPVERERLVAQVDRLKSEIGWAPSADMTAILRKLLISEGLISG